MAPDGSGTLDAMFVQVGGGAFATCLGAGLVEMGQHPTLMAVQAAGCAPLDRAWQLGATATDDWAAVMTPWTDPASLADGILDDETYDWIGVARGAPCNRWRHRRRHRSGTSGGHTSSRIGPASTPARPERAGLAGLLQAVDGGMPVAGGDRRVGVVISGVTR